VTYHLNRVQTLSVRPDLFLTLGMGTDVPEIAPAEVRGTFHYRHPIFDVATVAAQRELTRIDGPMTSFCGSYAGHGFHEDAVVSALRVVAALA
jgi:uncharacterized protein